MLVRVKRYTRIKIQMRTLALLLLSFFVCLPAVTQAKPHLYKHASKHASKRYKASRKQRRAYKRAQKHLRTAGRRHKSHIPG